MFFVCVKITNFNSAPKWVGRSVWFEMIMLEVILKPSLILEVILRPSLMIFFERFSLEFLYSEPEWVGRSVLGVACCLV